MIYKITYKSSELKVPYKILTEYFGANDFNLSVACEGGLDIEYELWEFVQIEQIIELLKKHNFDIDPNTPEGNHLLWGLYMNANINYGDLQVRREQWWYEENSPMDCEGIKLDLLKLYSILQSAKWSPITISTGKGQANKAHLSNTEGWFYAYMMRAIEVMLPEIDSTEKAKALYKEMTKKTVGAKLNIDFASVCVGVSRLFQDCKLIEGNTTNDMCRFIKDYLELMNATEEDRKKDEDTIKSTITNHIKDETTRFTPHITKVKMPDDTGRDEWMCYNLFFKKREL